MKIIANQLYHIYNQGNNKELIFREHCDYILFLKKFREKLLHSCQVVSYCLMPNHFHFLINTTDKSVSIVKLGRVKSTQLGNGFRLLCSGYSNEFNKKYGRSGSLFRQKTQAKNLEVNCGVNRTNNYPLICFNYIHQNPLAAGLTDKMENWEFSSFRDYFGTRNGTLVTKSLAFDLVGVNRKKFYEESYQIISHAKVKEIFTG